MAVGCHASSFHLPMSSVRGSRYWDSLRAWLSWLQQLRVAPADPDKALPSTNKSCRGRSGQRVGPHVIAEFSSERAVAAVDRDDVLLAAGLIGHRRRLAAGRKAVLPKLSAIANVERADIVIHRSRDEDDAARGDDRTAQHGNAELEWQRQRGLIADRADAMLPGHFVRPKIDRCDVAPRRSKTGNAER